MASWPHSDNTYVAVESDGTVVNSRTRVGFVVVWGGSNRRSSCSNHRSARPKRPLLRDTGDCVAVLEVLLLLCHAPCFDINRMLGQCRITALHRAADLGNRRAMEVQQLTAPSGAGGWVRKQFEKHRADGELL